MHFAAGAGGFQQCGLRLFGLRLFGLTRAGSCVETLQLGENKWDLTSRYERTRHPCGVGECCSALPRASGRSFLLRPALRLPTMVAAAAPADLGKRLGKRLRSISVVQSQAPFCFYAALWLLGEDVPALVPPNVFDLNMSCRRWRWLMRTYDVSLKVFFVVRANALLTFLQPTADDPTFEQGGVFPENV